MNNEDFKYTPLVPLVSHEETRRIVKTGKGIFEIATDCHAKIMENPNSAGAQHVDKTYSLLLQHRARLWVDRDLQTAADLLSAIKKGMDDTIKNNAPVIFNQFYNYCFLWLCSQEEKNLAVHMGDLLLLQRNAEAAKQFITEKVQAYQAGIDSGAIPKTITITHDTKEVLEECIGRYETLLNASNTDATNDIPVSYRVDMSGRKLDYCNYRPLVLYGQKLLDYAPGLKLETDPATGKHKLTGGPLILPGNAGFCIPKVACVETQAEAAEAGNTASAAPQLKP